MSEVREFALARHDALGCPHGPTSPCWLGQVPRCRLAVRSARCAITVGATMASKRSGRGRGWHRLAFLLRLEAIAHKGLAVVTLQCLRVGVRVALFHLLLLGHRLGLFALQALRHERLALVALHVASLSV